MIYLRFFLFEAAIILQNVFPRCVCMCIYVRMCVHAHSYNREKTDVVLSKVIRDSTEL